MTEFLKTAERITERGEVFTPPSLVKLMLDKLPLESWTDPTKTFLDSSAGRLLLDDPPGKTSSPMKFDVIVGNPPYGGGSQPELHLRFLLQAFNALTPAGQLVFLQPATPFINRKKNKTTLAKRLYNELAKHVLSLDLLDGETTFLDADVNTFIVVTHVTKLERLPHIKLKVKHLTGEITEHQLFDDVSIFPQEAARSLRRKLQHHVTSLETHRVDKTPSAHHAYVVHLARIQGGRKRPSYYSFGANLCVSLANKTSNGIPFEFNTQAEGENFITYLQTNFARRALSLLKVNVHIDRGELALVPYLDFTRTWTDEQLALEFKLTQPERDFVNSILKT
jgi:hypothetical protein